MSSRTLLAMKPNPGASRAVKPLAALLMTSMVVAQALPGAHSAQAATFPDPAMQTVWNRTDQLVQGGQVSRSWMWGPDVFYSGYEPYAEGVNGQHLVAYFDKARMEINNPNGDRNSPWFVTNGLLVVEMMTGRIQTGNNSFMQVAANNKPIAGDGGAANTPTYSTLAALASLNGDHRTPSRVGQAIVEGLQNTGGVGIVNNLGVYSNYGAYDQTLGHNIPDVFWNFMNQKGPVNVGGKTVQDTVIDWTFAMGYPITEPYWMPIQVGAEQRWVLVQAFQRRILTYTPSNPPGFQVEMGNVGRAYYDWRYAQAPGQTPTPTPIPAPPGQASISINPTQGDSTTSITVNGVNFPPNSQVSIKAERADANYIAGIAVVKAGGDGKFSFGFKLPADAARFDSVTISAIAGSGGAKATAEYHLNFRPTISISPKDFIANGGNMTVTGGGFPANTTVQVGIAFDGAGAEYPASARTDGNGAFQTSFNIGHRAAGSRFLVFATADGGLKASYNDRVTVINQPSLQVTPGSGPAGVSVSLHGSGWPAGEQVTIGYRGVGDSSEGLLTSIIPVDGNGNFTIQVYVDPSLSGKKQVVFSATSNIGLRAETTYTVTSNQPPPPSNPTIKVTPGSVQIGHDGTVNGTGWTPGSQVTIALAGAGKQQNVAGTIATDAGTFSAAFHVDNSWSNAGQVQVVARSSDNRTATASLVVVTPGSGGNGLENGLGMTVQTYQGVGTPYVKLSGAGWKAGRTLTVSVISAGGDVNFGVASTIVNADGSWQAAFDNTGPWVGRSDIGVRVSDQSGGTFSGRRLPVSTLVKVEGGNYTIVGSNWGANTQVEAVLQIDSRDSQVLGTGGVDANGNVNVNVTIPRADGSRSVVLRSKNAAIQYIAVFGIDARAGKMADPIEGASTEVQPRIAAPINTEPGMPKTGSENTLWYAVLVASVFALASGLVIKVFLRKESDNWR